jgi:hypothetical protein
MRAKHIWVCLLGLAVAAAMAAAGPQKNAGANASGSSSGGTTAGTSTGAPQGATTGAAAGSTASAPSHGEAARDSNSEAAEESSDEAKLPVRRVVLYKSGVGYFEHLGRVRGDQTVRIDFTSGQLNDVLQSLTILDLNGGRIAGVNYNSEAPLSQRLGTLRLPLEEKTDLAEFYGALRGARLEIRSGTTTITGRLLSMERKTRVSGGTTLEVDLATLVSDTGEVHSVEITPAVSVRLAEHEVNEEVGRYLSLLGSVRQQDLRRMNISTAGSGDRQLYVSYVSEVPIWKTTYRVVLPSKAGEEPLLQGWAIVDNTVGEDWNDVELSLVAGAPQSFIQQLSQPYYARRPVVPLPQSMQLTPQTHESAMMGGAAGLSGLVTDQAGAIVANAQVALVNNATQETQSVRTDGQGRYQFDTVSAGDYNLQVNMPGFSRSVVQGISLRGGHSAGQNVTLSVGSVAQTVTVAANALTVQTSESEVGSTGGGFGAGLGSGAELGKSRALAPGLGGGSGGGVLGGVIGSAQPEAIAEARRLQNAAALGTDLGDLFEYKLKDRVTIRKNESALVPIVQAHVAAEKVSVWNASLGTPRPLRALWLTNSSPLTLDNGSFTVLENETYAGEGLTDAIKPGEKRLLSYAADLGVRVTDKSENDPQRVTHVRIARGLMIQTSEMRQMESYTVRNDDTTARTVVIEHPLRGGWTVSPDTPKPEETTSNTYRFVVHVEPKDTQILEVKEAEPIATQYQLTNLDANQLEFLIRQKSINSEIEAAFRKILEKKDAIVALNEQSEKLDAERTKIFDDQQRLRENLKALKGSAEERALTQRYTQQLADQENRLDALNKESADLQARETQAQAELDKMIEDLTFDTTI